MTKKRISTWTKSLLAAFIITSMGFAAIHTHEGREPPERRRSRQSQAKRTRCGHKSRSKTDAVAAGELLDYKILFEVSGTDGGRPFLSLLDSPEKFRSVDQVCDSIADGLRGLPIWDWQINSIVKFVREFHPSFYEQLSESTVLVGIRVLIEGPLNADKAWIKSGFESDQQHDINLSLIHI